MFLLGEQMYYVYKIVNKANKKCYIGVTNSPKRRMNEHMKRQSTWGCPKLQRAVAKYGRDSFEMFILYKTFDKSFAYTLEVLFIQKYESYREGYNASLGGEGSDRYVPWNKATKGLCKPNKTSFKRGDKVGEKHGRSKLTDSQRREVYERYLLGETPKQMEKDYPVHWSNLYRAIKYIQKQEMEQA